MSTTAIVLNGREMILTELSVSYDEIATMALELDPTVTWRLKDGSAAGTLTRGDRIIVSDGLIVNAVNTGNA